MGQEAVVARDAEAEDRARSIQAEMVQHRNKLTCNEMTIPPARFCCGTPCSCFKAMLLSLLRTH